MKGRGRNLLYLFDRTDDYTLVYSYLLRRKNNLLNAGPEIVTNYFYTPHISSNSIESGVLGIPKKTQPYHLITVKGGLTSTIGK